MIGLASKQHTIPSHEQSYDRINIILKYIVAYQLCLHYDIHAGSLLDINVPTLVLCEQHYSVMHIKTLNVNLYITQDVSLFVLKQLKITLHLTKNKYVRKAKKKYSQIFRKSLIVRVFILYSTIVFFILVLQKFSHLLQAYLIYI